MNRERDEVSGADGAASDRGAGDSIDDGRPRGATRMMGLYDDASIAPMTPDRSPAPTLEPLPVTDGEVAYCPALFARGTADALLQALLDEVAWTQHVVRIRGREVLCPRLSAWYGDPGAAYAYSGLRLDPMPWIAPVQEIREAVEGATGAHFNSVLLNRYRDGADSMGWHADDEPELGPEPLIASVSLGAPRRFLMQHRRRRDVPRFELAPAHGSLLLMGGATQRHWRHCVPKTRLPVGVRVNLTFRIIAP